MMSRSPVTTASGRRALRLEPNAMSASPATTASDSITTQALRRSGRIAESSGSSDIANR